MTQVVEHLPSQKKKIKFSLTETNFYFIKFNLPNDSVNTGWASQSKPIFKRKYLMPYYWVTFEDITTKISMVS
jgi:hypothetical protein